MTAIDTNVLVYAGDQDSPAKRQQSLQLIRTTTDGVILWQVACEFLNASRKKPMPGDSTQTPWIRLEGFLEVFPLVLPDRKNIASARHLMLSHQLQLWDALIYAACIEAGIPRLYSEDLPARLIPNLQIINPFA